MNELIKIILAYQHNIQNFNEINLLKPYIFFNKFKVIIYYY